MDGVLGQMELAALPCRAAEDGPAGGAQAGVVVGDDVFDAAHAARLQALQEGPPVNLGLGQGDGDAEHPAALVRADADRREHGGVTHDAAVAHLLVAGIEDQIPDLAERPGAPGLQFVVEQLGGAADLRRRQALDAELAHHRLGFAGRDALDVHLGHRQHHGAHRPAAALQRLRVERRAVMAGGLGNVDRDRAGRRVDALGLVAVGIALPLGACARRGRRRETARARSASPARTPARRPWRCRSARVRSDVPRGPQPSYPCVRPFALLHGWFCNSMEYQSGSPLPGQAPAGAHGASAKRISRRQVTVPAQCALRALHERCALRDSPILKDQFR